MHTGFCLRNLWDREHLKDLGIDWRKIINKIKEIVWDSVNCNNLAQDEHKWQAVAKEVMNMRFS